MNGKKEEQPSKKRKEEPPSPQNGVKKPSPEKSKKVWRILSKNLINYVHVYMVCTVVGTKNYHFVTFSCIFNVEMWSLAWENRQHFSTNDKWNDVWGTKCRNFIYWWCVNTLIWAVLLIGHAVRETCFNRSEVRPRSGKKHVILWNFYAHFSVIITFWFGWSDKRLLITCSRLHNQNFTLILCYWSHLTWI